MCARSCKRAAVLGIKHPSKEICTRSQFKTTCVCIQPQYTDKTVTFVNTTNLKYTQDKSRAT